MIDIASKMTIFLADNGMMNNRNICIKKYNSTIACLCKSCQKELKESFSKFSKEFIKK